MQICLRNRPRIVGLLTVENIYFSARFNFGTICKAHVRQMRTKTHRHIKTAIKIIYVRRRRVLRPREICILSFVAFVCSIIACRKRRVDVLHYDLPQNLTTSSLLPLSVQWVKSEILILLLIKIHSWNSTFIYRYEKID